MFFQLAQFLLRHLEEVELNRSKLVERNPGRSHGAKRRSWPQRCRGSCATAVRAAIRLKSGDVQRIVSAAVSRMSQLLKQIRLSGNVPSVVSRRPWRRNRPESPLWARSRLRRPWAESTAHVASLSTASRCSSSPTGVTRCAHEGREIRGHGNCGGAPRPALQKTPQFVGKDLLVEWTDVQALQLPCPKPNASWGSWNQ